MAAVVASGLLFTPGPCRDFGEGTLEVRGEKLALSVAASPAERTTGLAGCVALPNQSGMYFPYETAQQIGFWMKGMVIPIDIVWIAEGKVVGVQENVPVIEKTAVDPAIYYPPVPVTGVLEVAAGKAKEYGLTVGTTVHYLPKQ